MVRLPLSLGADPATEAGVDEAGRGCLAGPVCAAAVVLPQDADIPLLNDSKQLTEKRRFQLEPIIKATALAWGVAWASAEEIDQYNILNASILAMHRALDLIELDLKAISVDGNRFKPYTRQGLIVPHVTVVHGDARLANIAAASILAKTARDRLMTSLANEYPAYGWEVNKGYPTKAHRQAIALHGPCPLHRTTFRLLPS